MILEGIVTTQAADGRVNIAPMGPTVDESQSPMRTFVLRPFKSSQTYLNLKHRAEGVLHVTDDVLLMAEAVLGIASSRLEPATVVKTPRLADCCRYFEFSIDQWDESEDRTRLTAAVRHSAFVRDFFGFNRAKHAVVEAAILASRIGILPLDQIVADFRPLKTMVEKTGGINEHRAFDLLWNRVISTGNSSAADE